MARGSAPRDPLSAFAGLEFQNSDMTTDMEDVDYYDEFDYRPLALQNLPITEMSSRWLRFSNFADGTRMNVWCVTVLSIVYMRLYGPWAPFVSRWQRLVMRMLTAYQTYNMGVPHPFGRVPEPFLNRIRRFV